MFVLLVACLVAFSHINWNESEVPGEAERDPLVSAEDAVAEEGLHPLVEEAKEELLQRASDRDINVVITEGYRSPERQDELYARGRTADGDVVTNASAGESYHNYGLAIDYALETEDGLVWDIETDFNGSGEADWLEVAEIAKDIGFEWGGDWSSFRDYPHLQMTFGLSIQELQQAKQQLD
ncbi:M15 family metallopeptidase [Bacillus luteus]|uniref:M15 family metallopeptidase n=2 Tax=Alkalicoccus luteus TaxID=1237094 RepID=A0A969TU66_9BACI|nr:M15 family metallopeptidase [Alkalicoccus luteus]